MTTAIAALLSTREFEILEAMAQGMSTREIAKKFTVSVVTVQNQYGHIYQKLGVNSQLKAVAMYHQFAVNPGDFVAVIAEKYGVQLTDKHRTELRRIFRDARVHPNISRSNHAGWRK